MDERFEKYFLSLLSDEEKQQLFEDLEKDAILKKEFAKAQNFVSFLEMYKKQDDDIYSSESFKIFKRKRTKFIAKKITLQFSKYAAIMLLLVGLWTLIDVAVFKQTVRYTNIEVPAGQRVRLELSDGSEVWLGSRSKLKIPDKFVGKMRTVELDGEALFTVSKNKEKPFIVKTKEYNVKVLGTKFNVFSYSQNSSFETLLLEGSVCVYNKNSEDEQLYMSPNEKVILKNNKLEKIGNFSDNALYLENGVYDFSNLTMQEILGRLEMWYDVKFDVTNRSLLRYTLSGKFRKEDSIKDILLALQKASPFRFNMISKTEIEIY